MAFRRKRDTSGSMRACNVGKIVMLQLFRAKIYAVKQRPGRRRLLKVAVGYGPWVGAERRAQNLVNHLNNEQEPNREVWLQRAEIFPQGIPT